MGALVSDIVRDLVAQGVRLPKLRVVSAMAVPVPVAPVPPLQNRGAVKPSDKTGAEVSKRRAQVADLWQRGKSSRYIAARLGILASTVTSDVFLMQKAGQVARRKVRSVDVEPRRAAVADLCKQGLTAAAVAERLNLRVTLVRADICVLQDRGVLWRRADPRTADRRGA